VIEDWLSRSPTYQINLISTDNIRNNQDDDILIKSIKETIKNDLNFDNEQMRITKCNSNQFILENEILFYVDAVTAQKKHRRIKRIVLPQSCVKEILDLHHSSPIGGHLGFERLLAKVSQEYWFPNMYIVINKYLEYCDMCEINR